MSSTPPALSAPALLAGLQYSELRQHELRKSRVMMIDGNLTQNSSSSDGGTSARVYRDGYWGFASVPATGADATERVGRQARDNVQAMARFGQRSSVALPMGGYRGEHVYRGRAALDQAEIQDRLGALNAWCKQRYPGLKSIRFVVSDEHHTKWLATSTGGQSLASIQRAVCQVVFVAQSADGAPVELAEQVSGKGSLADIDWSIDTLAPQLDELHRHLRAKCEAVPARGGLQTVVLAPPLAGMLAHEAMGHPCEADIVLGGAVTGSLRGQRVASDLISMVDYAHHYQGTEVMIPVYADDEGTPARDAVLIKDGVLTEFMNSRETAARLGMALTGSARAYAPSDEPLVRMRNTAILPGKSTLDEMVAGVDDGYLLLKTANGQADSTTEFMFGISLAYEIRSGKLGPAIRDTTVSGSAIKVLQSVDAVSSDMYWSCSGYCGKKQPMVVSMGGPALRARAHMGGE
ncbi:MAG TPA: TldD/PmbA family protein [Ideonella sp.]|uniref:TldD/PmbA family protein n=1 Tax=Ideonella sp. TaxID=1929293 RepID=UPI002E2F1CC7|nr:TldD/PmbA family protein [Ideonella sp.]HEX5683994.1 TldD/PmbA family protein [Ideonella sp.]